MSDDIASATNYRAFAPVYIVGTAMSLISAVLGIVWSCKGGKRVSLLSQSGLILVLTICDVLYSLKFAVSAIAWYARGSPEDQGRMSFHLFRDNCMSSVVYEQCIGILCVALNAVKVLLGHPSPLPSQVLVIYISHFTVLDR
jgi:hypothetical protein